MLVGGELEGLALVVLSACESGTGSLGAAKLDEATGLPAAMQLGGAASVWRRCGRWATPRAPSS